MSKCSRNLLSHELDTSQEPAQTIFPQVNMCTCLCSGTCVHVLCMCVFVRHYLSVCLCACACMPVTCAPTCWAMLPFCSNPCGFSTMSSSRMIKQVHKTHQTSSSIWLWVEPQPHQHHASWKDQVTNSKPVVLRPIVCRVCCTLWVYCV